MKPRREPLPSRNAARRAKSFERNFGDHAEFVRERNCYAGWGNAGAFCEGLTVAHHARSRGAGGTSRDLVPLCGWHHYVLHNDGQKTFEKTHGINLQKLAAELWREHYPAGEPG